MNKTHYESEREFGEEIIDSFDLTVSDPLTWEDGPRTYGEMWIEKGSLSHRVNFSHPTARDFDKGDFVAWAVQAFEYITTCRDIAFDQCESPENWEELVECEKFFTEIFGDRADDVLETLSEQEF